MTMLLRALAILAAASTLSAAQNAKPLFKSHVVTTETVGHVLDIDVELPGDAKEIFLVVSDGGNDFGCDWADWAEPRFIMGDGAEKRLTDLKWKSAKAGFGETQVNANVRGQKLRVAGKDIAYGIGTHANSLIVYDVPAGAKRFKARGALDEGGTKQQGGTATSVQFAVYKQNPGPITAPSVATGTREPKDAVAALDVHPDLAVTLFASEPLLLSPSAIDVDHRGRIWVCEVVNYRKHNGERKEGDRILIVDDANGDGVADKQTVFYQGTDVDSAHGICVLGNRALVSCGDDVFWLIDTNGDDKSDKKELLFTKIGGAQHDHGIHAFHFGPDGRLYFNFGNSGKQLCDAKGNLVTDIHGVKCTNQNNLPHQEGMVFRCEMDGSKVEMLGWNFRNNWEVGVDSFGSIWQSDNDDDGNKGVRINEVVEFGNYGYKDEMTGAGWQSERTNIEEEIPLRHWHLNDPGVMPNLLQTGAGSPTGICIYEGALLPRAFQGQIIHCDAGPNVVRAYPVTSYGAGWKAEMLNIVEGARDKWFRPSDVAVAPDGSLIVADWYDPGVGGHGMGDVERGRLFRVAPKGSKWSVPKNEFDYIDKAAVALTSPNEAARYLAWTALRKMEEKAAPALEQMWRSENPRHRARALWLLGRLDAKKWVNAAIEDKDDDIRITGLRLARQLGVDVIPLIAKLANDESARVSRECAITLSHNKSPEAPALWAKLAIRHDGQDRWYLEALGIGADGQWDTFLSAYSGITGTFASDIIWRSRAKTTSTLLAKSINASEPLMLRAMRALDFQPAGAEKDAAIASILTTSTNERAVIEAVKRLPSFEYAKATDSTKAAIQRYLAKNLGSKDYFQFVQRFGVRDEADHLMQLALDKPTAAEGIEAVRTMLALGDTTIITGRVSDKDHRLLKPLGSLGLKNSSALLASFFTDGKSSVVVQKAVVAEMVRTREGASALLKLVAEKKVAAELMPGIGSELAASPDPVIRGDATKHFGVTTAAGAKLPPVTELVKRKGNAENGRAIYQRACFVCHQIGEQGIMFGPALTEIGTKLPKDALYASILEPSAAITMGFEGWEVKQKDGTTMLGLITSDAGKEITLRIIGGVDNKIARGDIAQRKKIDLSLMPPGLATTMSEQELVDLIEFLSAQVKK